MSALAEALATAKPQALARLGKHYVGGRLDRETVGAALEAMGETDTVDRERWFAALDTIRNLGGEAPEAEPVASRKAPPPATDRQLSLIYRLCDEKVVVRPDEPLSKEAAHTVIEELKAGTYDPDKWKLGF